MGDRKKQRNERKTGRAVSFPPCMHGDAIPLNSIDPCDARIYYDARERARVFYAQRGVRAAYARSHVGVPFIFTCIDEKEQDTEEGLGLIPGVANVIQIAGNKIDHKAYGGLVQRQVQEAVVEAAASGKVVIVLFIMHECASDPHDGCAAWNNDVPAADRHASSRAPSLSMSVSSARRARGATTSLSVNNPT